MIVYCSFLKFVMRFDSIIRAAFLRRRHNDTHLSPHVKLHFMKNERQWIYEHLVLLSTTDTKSFHEHMGNFDSIKDEIVTLSTNLQNEASTECQATLQGKVEKNDI